MNRKEFIFTAAMLTQFSHVLGQNNKPDVLFFEDDGIVPNSRYPLLRYRKAFSEKGERGAVWLEDKFLSNNWSNNWRNGIFDFQHYHSITHEVLGIYSGDALVLLGGDKGKQVTVEPGDIIVIPAGVGHKNLGSHNLGVVGAYPNGMPVDVIRCEPGDRPRTDKNIAVVPFPDSDPFFGSGGLKDLWKV